MARYPDRIATQALTQYRYRIIRNRSSITKLLLGVDLPDALRFSLRRESPFDWLGKAIGLAREWQTNDPTFDPLVYIQSDDMKLHEVLSLDAQLRIAVEKLFSIRTVDSIEMDEGVLWIQSTYDRELYGAQTDPEIAGRLAEVALADLLIIKARLASLSAESWQGQRDPYLVRYRFLLGAGLVLGLAGMMSLSWAPGPELPHALLRDHIQTQAFIVVAIAFAVSLVLILAMLGRSSRTHRAVAWMLFICMPGIGAAASVFYEYQNNDSVDQQPPFKTYVTDLKTSGRHRTYHTAYFTIMPEERMNRALRVDAATFSALRIGECVNLEIRNGALGDPVLAGITEIPCE